MAVVHRVRQTVRMPGPILIVVALLVVLPISFFVIGTVLSVLLGHTLRKEGEYMNEGSELIELNT
jgi:uncharacterized metal-binding protein